MSDESRQVSGKLVHGLWGRVLGGSLPPALVAELEAQGLDAKAIDTSVPWSTFLAGAQKTAQVLYPGASDGLERLAERVVQGVRAQIPGAVLTVGKLMGPKRVLEKAAAQELKGITWLKLQYQELGRKEVALTVNEPAATPFLLGALRGLLAQLGTKATVRQERPGRVVASW